MSAPLAVNTVDGTVWTRREGTRGGEALYAPEKCGTCPAFVMVTMTELAELGIEGSADVLPMPAGPVRDVEDELTGARLALFEEEQETAALREERHSTNEALDDAIRALRVAQERIAELERSQIDRAVVIDDFIARCEVALSGCCSECDAAAAIVKGRRQAALDGASVPEWSAGKLTALLAPAQVLREDDEFHLRHSYRVGRDLPPLGGQR